MPSRHHPSLRRLASLAAAGVIAAGLIATPVAAAPSRTAGAAVASPIADRAAGSVINRGRVVAREAAAATRGITRANHAIAKLAVPGLSSRLGQMTPKKLGVSPRISISAPISMNAFAGNDGTTDNLQLEPPDPWVAVSGTYVVHSTNGLIRVFNRTGTELMSISPWALFALDVSEYDSDPRILWDAAHGRWVGVLLSFTLDGTNTVISAYLNVAVSETADPTGAWRDFGYGFRDRSDSTRATLPDYPGIASSADKLVLASNEFSDDLINNDNSYIGSSVLAIRWADILSYPAPAPVLWTAPDPTLFTIRPARLSSAGSDVHLVAEDVNNGDVMYARLAGLSPVNPTGAWTDLSAALVDPVSPFCLAVAPHQPGSPDTIVDAVDERPTDAVWSQGHLAIVSTCAQSSVDFARVIQVDTTASPPAPTADDIVGDGSSDAYLGGIGFSTDGTLFLDYTQSSLSEYPSTYIAASKGGAWSPSVLINAGSTTYSGSRWGDYTGIATDPSGSAAVWQSNEIPNSSGSWETQVSRLVLDLVPPTVTAPTQSLVSGSTLGSRTLPVKVAWTAADAGSGVVRTDLGCNAFSLGFVACGSSSGASVTRSEYWKWWTSLTNRSYQYGVFATDAYGNASGGLAGLQLTATVYEQTAAQVTWSGRWTTATSSSSNTYSNKSVRYSGTVGAYASFRVSGRSFGFLTYRASTRGRARIYVDGVLKTTLTLTSSTVKARNLAYTITFASSGTHTIKVVVYSGRVDVDGFVVIR